MSQVEIPTGTMRSPYSGRRLTPCRTAGDRAGDYVGQEAGALRETVLLADSLPPEVRTSVRQAIQRHLHFVESEEWPAMARRQASLRSIAVGLVEALSAVLSFAPVQINQQLAQQRAVVAIEHARSPRSHDRSPR